MASRQGRIKVRIIAATAFLLGVPAAGAAQDYPNKPVRVVVAFAAGGFTDTTTRRITMKLGERLGQNFVVDNRGGAGGNLGAKIVAGATPDGYTMLTHTAASSVNETLYPNKGFELLKDFTPVANTVSTPGLFTVLASHPARNLRHFIELARGKRITYATAGVGTSSHIAADYLLRVLAKLDAEHVPFKGGNPASIALLGGQVDLMNSSASAIPHIRAGRMRAIAVSSLKRSEAMPDVPTVAEAGFPGFEERSWVGFFVPAGTPVAVVKVLNQAINEALRQPDLVANFKGLGMDIHHGSAAEFRHYVQNEIANWRKMIKTTGVKLN
jgi:tripartite-type tricarboxylate transporter receptor subunit TctC